ncbi:MAG TPA: Ig-like domain-containing protein, partial [Gemmatimonadales bacterium]|nr:Ig-like domain-containing protein [Gemmatimonadales bacterium]
MVAVVLLSTTCSDERAPVTAPPGAPLRPTTVATVATPDVLVGAGNIGRCGKTAPAATAAIVDTIPGLVFTAGDNVYASGSSADFVSCYDPSWGRHKSRTRPAVGDKDYATAGASGYFGYFGAAAGDPALGYYSYDLTDWHVIVLNSGSSSISTKAGSPQEQWLRADLAANTKRCIMAYWHHARFSSSGSAVRSSLKPLWDDLYAAHADIVVNAHARVYERFAPQTPTGTADPQNGIREFIVGTGGQGLDSFNAVPTANSEVRIGATYGVLKLTLGPGTYSWSFIPIAGQTAADAGGVPCHGAAPAPVARVSVTPSSATITPGSTVQLTAQPLDAAGNPLSGRAIAWQTSDAGIAGVSSSGLVSGVTVGPATITATSEGQSGTASITVIAPPPPDAQCLDRLGPTITLNGLRTADYANTALIDNTRVDATTAQFLTGTTHPVILGGGFGGCFHGGEIHGQLPPATDWNTMHDTYAFRTEGLPGFELEDVREFDYGDGISLKDNTSSWVIRRVHFKYMRDDCVQNDWLNAGTIDSSFFDGCSTGISARPPSSTNPPDGSSNVLVIKNSLFALQDMDQGYQVPGHGGFFKWSATGPMVSLYGNVFRVDSPNSLGTHTLGPPAGKLADCANNVMIWLGPGPFPETLPSCYTLLTGAAGLDFWNNAVAAWNALHPNPLPDAAPPIVSLYAPQTGATLFGAVNLTATAVDDRQVVGVQLQLNGQNLGQEITT